MRFDFICEREIDIDDIRVPTDVIPVFREYKNSPQEVFLCVTLNSARKPIKCRIVSVGTATSTVVHSRDVFRDAILDNASAIIVGHNHPSGTLSPSAEDLKLTQTLVDAGKIIGINVCDHIILSGENYFSFKEHCIIVE